MLPWALSSMVFHTLPCCWSKKSRYFGASGSLTLWATTMAGGLGGLGGGGGLPQGLTSGAGFNPGGMAAPPAMPPAASTDFSRGLGAGLGSGGGPAPFVPTVSRPASTAATRGGWKLLLELGIQLGVGRGSDDRKP